jgi:hypothetical protein
VVGPLAQFVGDNGPYIMNMCDEDYRQNGRDTNGGEQDRSPPGPAGYDPMADIRNDSPFETEKVNNAGL